MAAVALLAQQNIENRKLLLYQPVSRDLKL